MQETILIVTDMEGASGLRRLEQLHKRSGDGARALTLDIKAVVRAIRPLAKNIYIWDFDGNEDALKNEFGPKTKVISHPNWKFLKSIKASKVFLLGFHAREGLTKEFCPHTYSGDIRSFRVNGHLVGEATLFAHLFAQINTPIVFVSGSWYACEELQTLGCDVETVPVRKHRTVYDVPTVRQRMSDAARTAMRKKGTLVRPKKYTFDIVFKKPIARFFAGSHFTLVSDRHITGASAHFDTLYRDFANGIFTYWEDPFRL